MEVLKFIIITIWIAVVFLLTCWILFNRILPKYRITVAEVSFEELLLALNASINTEIELWEKDVFKGQKNVVGTNSRYDNYYHEITDTIIQSLSPIFFQNMSKYITEEAVATIIGRRVRIFLNEHTDTV